MTQRWLALAGALFALNALSGCVSIHRPAFAMPASSRDWTTSLDSARIIAGTGRYDAADSVLARFATRHPGTAEALETAYWRSLFKMDPMNPRGSLTWGLASLDAYLADPRPREHVLEATTLRRVGGALDGVNRTVAAAMAQVREANTTAADANARAADASVRPIGVVKTDPSSPLEIEVRRLRDELAKANSELDRIRKRLAQPPIKPPGT
jgi:hypothetical protein